VIDEHKLQRQLTEARADAAHWEFQHEKLKSELAEANECVRILNAELSEWHHPDRSKAELNELAALRAQEPAKPLPGADWTVTMRRMMDRGCSKRKCTCKPEDAPGCIWWDEPGDRPSPVPQPVNQMLLTALKNALWRLEQYNYQAMEQTIARVRAAIAAAEGVKK